jgi:hypothetical protein
MWIRSGHFVGAVAAAGISLINASQAAGGEDVRVTGTWRGESVCTTPAASCHNEAVVYYIEDVPDRPNLVTVRADKIVDGKAVTMGAGQWTHDRVHHTLEWRSTERVWLLAVSGNRIEGTLTLADKTVFRKMTLKKDE